MVILDHTRWSITQYGSTVYTMGGPALWTCTGIIIVYTCGTSICKNSTNIEYIGMATNIEYIGMAKETTSGCLVHIVQ